MNLIEKAARASHEFFRPIYRLPPWEEIPKDAQSMALQHARAVLADIREPTDGMLAVELAQTHLGNGPPNYEGGHNWLLKADKQVWQAMIDAGMAEP